MSSKARNGISVVMSAITAKAIALDLGKGQIDLALRDYDQVIASRVSPGFKTAVYYRRGKVYGLLGQFDRAIQDFNQELELDPKDAGALYHRGKAKEEKGDIAGAQADLANGA